MKPLLFCVFVFVGYCVTSSLLASSKKSEKPEEFDIGTIPDQPKQMIQPSVLEVTFWWLPQCSYRYTVRDPFGAVNVVIKVYGTLQLPRLS